MRTRTRPRTNTSDETWRIPKLWKGDECFVLGGGPSLLQVDVDKLRGRRVIAVNNIVFLKDWFDIMFYGDQGFFNKYRLPLRAFGGLKVTAIKYTGGHIDQRMEYFKKCINNGVKVVLRQVPPPGGLSLNPSVLFWNSSSGGCAINLATLLGAKRVVLCGFDMRRVPLEEIRQMPDRLQASADPSEDNWHSAHDKRKLSPYHEGNFLRPFPQIAKDARSQKIEIVNATPGSAIKEFPIVDPESVV